MKHAIHYRPDIDGLRALAILPVVLFHLDPGIMPGGYVGVDIFFVISGFLITSIVHRETIANRFSFALFYERRIRRLLPALVAVLSVSFIAAWRLLLPKDFHSFSESLAAASLFLANVFFWKKTDYFAAPADSLPLLHTWSLAVEEQFYIFFPPLLLLVMRYWPSRLNALLLTLSVLSLAWAQHVLQLHPESAFYLPHLRAWELLAGALLATGAIPTVHSHRLRSALAIAGLAMICGSLVFLDKATAFPGIAALPAVVGAALLIHTGTHGHTIAGKLLSTRLLMMIGLLSYSLYLWHWPLFVFVRYYLPASPVSGWVNVALLAAAILIAAFSWRFIERPFRHAGDRPRRKRLYAAALLALLASIALSFPGILTRGAEFRMPAEVVRIAAVAKERIPFRRPCFGLQPKQIASGQEVCRVGSPDQEASFLLWGDSHALALAHGIDQATAELGVSGHFLGRSACPPAGRPADERMARKHCTAFNMAAREHLRKHPGIRTVILAGYWSQYYRRSTELPFEAAFTQLMEELSASGYNLIVIDQVPEIGWNVPPVLAKSLLFGHTPPALPAMDAHRANLARFHALVASIQRKVPLQLVDVSPLLCPQDECLAERGGMPLYRDEHHLAKSGSILLKEALKAAFQPRLTPAIPTKAIRQAS